MWSMSMPSMLAAISARGDCSSCVVADGDAGAAPCIAGSIAQMPRTDIRAHERSHAEAQEDIARSRSERKAASEFRVCINRCYGSFAADCNTAALAVRYLEERRQDGGVTNGRYPLGLQISAANWRWTLGLKICAADSSGGLAVRIRGGHGASQLRDLDRFRWAGLARLGGGILCLLRVGGNS